MIQAVILDVGRVVLPISWDNVISHLNLSPEEGKKLGELVATGPHYDTYERGLMSTEDFFAGFKEHYDLHHPPGELEEAWHKLLLEPFDGLDEVLATLKNDVGLFALSNTNQAHYETFLDRFDIFHHFEEIFSSHKLNRRKPEPEIYTDVLSAIGIAPEKVLFIDDIDANVEGARSVGMNAEISVNSVDQLEAILRKYSLM